MPVLHWKEEAYQKGRIWAAMLRLFDDLLSRPHRLGLSRHFALQWRDALSRFQGLKAPTICGRICVRRTALVEGNSLCALRHPACRSGYQEHDQTAGLEDTAAQGHGHSHPILCYLCATLPIHEPSSLPVVRSSMASSPRTALPKPRGDWGSNALLPCSRSVDSAYSSVKPEWRPMLKVFPGSMPSRVDRSDA